MNRVCLVAAAMLMLSCDTPQPEPASDQNLIEKPIPGTREYEWHKFEHPDNFIADHDSGDSPGPTGTRWEPFYQSLMQTNETALAGGLPSHSAVLSAIDADASQSNLLTQQHKNYVFFVKHRSETERPAEGSEALRRLFDLLVDRQFRGEWETTKDQGLPFADATDLTILRDVPYGSDAPEYQTLDVYLVESERPTPVMIEFHGGGWRRGNKNQLHTYKGNFVRRMLDAGISLVAVDYRLTPDYRFPDQMRDATRAVQFVRYKAGEWNLDSSRVAAMGGSAGGHLTTWVALNDDQADPGSADPVARQSSRLTCFLTRWAPIDLTRVNPLLLIKKYGTRGTDYADAFCGAVGAHYEDYNLPQVQERVRAASPLFQLSRDDPPGFLMYGGTPKDFDLGNHPPVPEVIHDAHSFWYGVILSDAMKALELDHVPHIGATVSQDHETDVTAILAFLEKYLKS